MIKCKDSVRFQVLRSEIFTLFEFLEDTFARYDADCVVTCGTEAHGFDDPHTHGYAIDLRSKHLPEGDSHAVLNDLRTGLGANYTVLLEAEGTDNEHFHIQIRKDMWRELLKQSTMR